MKLCVDTNNEEIAVEATPSEAADLLRRMFSEQRDQEEWFEDYLAHNPVDYH